MTVNEILKKKNLSSLKSRYIFNFLKIIKFHYDNEIKSGEEQLKLDEMIT